MRLTVVDASPPRPTLDLVQVDATTMQLTWATNAAGFTLEFAENLPAQTWSPITNSVTTNGDLCSVQVAISGSKGFYRLRQ
jgi:hypothetical protein